MLHPHARPRETEKRVFALTQIRLSMRDLDRKRKMNIRRRSPVRRRLPAFVEARYLSPSVSFAPSSSLRLPTFHSSSFFVFLLEWPGYRLQIDDGENRRAPALASETSSQRRALTNVRFTSTIAIQRGDLLLRKPQCQTSCSVVQTSSPSRRRYDVTIGTTEDHAARR